MKSLGVWSVPAYKYKTKSGAVRWLVSFWYQDWTGDRKKKKKEGFSTRAEALAYEREFLLKYNRSTDMIFSSLVELYREDAQHRVRFSTFDASGYTIDRWLLPYFGNMKLGDIDAVAVRKWQNELMGSKNPRNGAPYSPTYLRSIHSRLSAIMNYAVTYYGLPQNPCHQAGSMGKKKAGELSFWTTAEFEAAMAQVKKPAYLMAFRLLYWLGIRSGECLALTPADIRPDKTLHIVKTHHRKNGADVAGPAKEDNSNRDVAMPPFLYDELLAYVGRLYDIGRDERIFYFNHGALNTELDRAASAAGVHRIRVHDLRHSHAALLIELGYSIVAVAERLGDTVEVAMNTYSHLYPNKLAGMAAELDAVASSSASLAALPSQLDEAENDAISG